MYGIQKQDNLDFWNLQNTYNSPQEQMKRYQAAGLNPHLAVSGGDPGSAGSLSSPSPSTPEFRTNDLGNAVGKAGKDGIGAYYDIEAKKLVNDNLAAQNDVIKQEFLLKQAQTFATQTSGKRGEFDLGLESDLRDTSLQARREALRKTQTDIQNSLDENQRRAIASATSVKMAAEQMKNLAEQRINYSYDRTKSVAETNRIRAENERIIKSIELMEKTGKLQDLELQLKANGVTWQDPLYQREISKLFTSMPGFLQNPAATMRMKYNELFTTKHK
ncbi:MAG: DNA pilot protein [Microvirus sp.]|nr:MAG: DNA pilot protein [Microvirus sp.]